MARSKKLHVEDPDHFRDRAFEYYVTGRFALLNNLQVAPNLFHHAVEMLAKYRLVQGLSGDLLAQEVKRVRNEHGHELDTLWPAFKDKVRDPALDRFDEVIEELNPWKDLRYGGYPEGFSTAMFFMRRREPYGIWAKGRMREYAVVLEGIDELFTAMVAASGISPSFLGEKHRLKVDFREWYAKENLHPMAEVFRTEPSVES
jgi:hypothetical protein